MPTSVGLYYPSIYFRDEAWLKLAALYWDKIARIVPTGFWDDGSATSKESETVAALQGELDFIRDFAPGPETEGIGRVFVDLLEAHDADLAPQYAMNKIDVWSIDGQVVNSNTGYIGGNVAPDAVGSGYQGGNLAPDEYTSPASSRGKYDPRVTYIHVGKISPRLKEALEQTGLGSRSENSRFIGVHPRLGSVYMAALAEGMATRLQVSPVSDNSASHLAAAGWTFERMAAVLLDQPELGHIARTSNELESSLASIAFASVVPKDIANVPVEKIVKLRTEHHDEFLEFHQALRDTIATDDQLASLHDAAALQMHLEVLYANNFAPHLKRLERNLGLKGIRSTRGAIGLLARLPENLPMLAGALATVGATAMAPALAPATAIVSFAIVPWLRDKLKSEERHQEGSDARAGYLLEVREGLTPRSVTESIAMRAERVVARAIGEAGGATA